MTSYTFGSLFSGIGGLDVGLERAGFICQWQVEEHAYRQEVLKKQWPTTTRFRDVRDVESTTSHPLIYLPGDSPVKMSPLATHAERKDLTEREAGYGQSSSKSFVNYDHITSSWRTSQLCFTGEWEEYSETWPQSGTMRSGRCYKRQISVPTSTETGFYCCLHQPSRTVLLQRSRHTKGR